MVQFANILGLTIGITSSLFLIFYIKDELSYDRFNKNAGRIYRISTYDKEPAKDMMKWSITPDPLAPELEKNYPEVEEAVSFNGNGKHCIRMEMYVFMQIKYFFVIAMYSKYLPAIL